VRPPAVLRCSGALRFPPRCLSLILAVMLDGGGFTFSLRASDFFSASRAARSLTLSSSSRASRTPCFSSAASTSRAVSCSRVGLGEALTRPADTSRSNRAAVLGLLSRWRLSEHLKTTDHRAVAVAHTCSSAQYASASTTAFSFTVRSSTRSASASAGVPAPGPQPTRTIVNRLAAAAQPRPQHTQVEEGSVARPRKLE
jgi:hypothetical protein